MSSVDLTQLSTILVGMLEEVRRVMPQGCIKELVNTKNAT